MPTDTRTSELVLNMLSKPQYENIPNPDPNQLYLVPEDEEIPYQYRGTYNIVVDLGLPVDASYNDIATVLSTEIPTPHTTDYCFVDVPYGEVVSGYDAFTTTAEYVGYYVVYNDVVTLVTNDNKDSVGIIAGTTVAYIYVRDYFRYIYRFKYNGNSWEYEYDVDFSGYANVDASNFTTTGEDYLTGLSFMSDRFEQLVPISGASYTAPADGYFSLDGILVNTTGNRLYLLYRPNKTYLSGNKTASMAFGVLSSYRQYVWIPVKKGGVVYVTAEGTASNPDFSLRFYYANGADYTPPEYTPVEYIEGTSNVRYIKSCIVPNSGMKLYCKTQIIGNTSTFAVFGARNVTYDGAQMNISTVNQNVVVDWFGGTNSANRWTVSTPVAQNDIFELEIENSFGTLTRNGTVIGTRTFTPTGAITRELFLTALNNNGALGAVGTTGRLYKFKLWDGNGDLIMDMQPAKDSANVACLYNTVTQTLYYNQGTGSYTAGPDIN